MRTALLKIHDALIVYLNSVDWQRNILALKIICLIISGLLLITLFILIFRLRGVIKKSLETAVEIVEGVGLSKKVIDEQWQAVLDKLEKGDADKYKLAVIEADKIFDDLLKRIGYKGEDMGERLKQINPAQITNIDEIWQAHKVRNRLVHDPDFQINRSQAKRAVEIYQRALEDLGTL